MRSSWQISGWAKSWSGMGSNRPAPRPGSSAPDLVQPESRDESLRLSLPRLRQSFAAQRRQLESAFHEAYREAQLHQPCRDRRGKLRLVRIDRVQAFETFNFFSSQRSVHAVLLL